MLTSNENVFFQYFVRQDLPSSSLLLNCDRSLPLSLKKTPDGRLSQSLKNSGHARRKNGKIHSRRL